MVDGRAVISTSVPGIDKAWAEWAATHPSADEDTFYAGWRAAGKFLASLDCWHTTPPEPFPVGVPTFKDRGI